MGVKVREKVEGSGVWWVFINHKGSRASKCVGSEAAAQEVKEIVEARLKLGQPLFPDEKPVPTLKEYYTKFKRRYLETAVKQSTLDSYETSFKNHVLPALGTRRLNQISRARVKDFIADLIQKQKVVPAKKKTAREIGDRTVEEKTEPKKLSRLTIWTILRELCSVLNHAKEDGLIQENPATRLGKFYKQAHVVHEEIEPLTRDEVPIFLQTAREHYSEQYPLFLCAIHTGLRSGELAGLQWGDIDFNGKFLTVRRNVVRGRVTTTKTDKVRRVDMSDALIEALLELKRKRKADYLKEGKNEIPEWVFCNQEGKPADMQNVKNRVFHKCLTKAKLRRIRFHDLRHTFASLLIQDGQSLAYVKEQLGHSSIKLTVDVYGHLVPGANRQAVNRLPTIADKKEHQGKIEQVVGAV